MERFDSNFNQLLQKNWKYTYGTALRYTKNRVQAMDLASEANIKALRFARHFVMGSNFRAWMTKIVMNLFMQAYRRHQREQRCVRQMSLAKHTEIHASQNMCGNWHSLKLSATMSNALWQLPPSYLVVVVLYGVYGYSYQNLADMLAVPCGTVMSRLFRGRKLLSKILTKPKYISRGDVGTKSCL